MRVSTFALSLVAVAALAACDSPSATDRDAFLRVQLTDAPADYLASAVVEIGRIELLPADGGPRVVVVEDGGSYDLLQLQNGVTADLGGAHIESGRYREMRMIVESAELTLADGYQFEDGSTTQTLFVPSGAQSGIKVKLTAADGDTEPGVEISPGETVLVVDFDVSQNFVMQGSAETPAGIKGFLFTPTLRAIVRDVAGSIAGTVTAPGEMAPGLSVAATRDGETEVYATTVVQADGTFLFPFVAPGSYNVTVVVDPDTHTVNTVAVTIGESENFMGVALTVVAK